MRLGGRELQLSAGSGARALALGLLAEASAAAEVLARGASGEALHDFRVALRRLRSALRALRPWLDDVVSPRDEKKLKRIARSTNDARDAEVQLEWLATNRKALAAPRLRAGLGLLAARLEGRMRRAPDWARVAERHRRAAEKLARRLRTYEAGRNQPAGRRFGRVLASLIGDRVAALGARMNTIRSAADEEEIHRARIEGKRLRYLLEPLLGCRIADTRGVIGRLKRLQHVLGELHDAHVLAAELRDALVDASAQEARRLHAAVYGPGAPAVREGLRESGRAGLVALLRLVRVRRDALHAELERQWRPGGIDALVADAGAVVAALGGRALKRPNAAHGRGRAATRPRPRRRAPRPRR